ncbi:mitochondrial import inner membrane translocase subunit TIM16 [Pseudocyphellaria aurata]|nr:mitochondrial import inner membrane translocase subunit TIM16 [Pseudocyphellaria aurata]
MKRSQRGSTSKAFRRHNIKQGLRRSMYREAAEESPCGHTPPEVRERRAAELKAMDEMPSSDQSSDGDEGLGATPDGKARAEKARPAAEQASRSQPQEAHRLSTPPLSADSLLPTPRGRKRQRDEEEEEYPKKTCVISTARPDALEGDKPDGSQVKGRKRLQADAVDDEGEGERERPVKARKTAAPRRPPSQAHRILIQIAISSTRVLGRAVTEAWRQASAAHSWKQDKNETLGQYTSKASTLASAGLSLSEACQILNVKPPKEGQLSAAEMAVVMDRFKQLYDANEVANGGSFYLQSKVLRARERIQREVEDQAEMREDEKIREGWKPKIYKD